MPTVAVVDDRVGDRETLVTRLDLELQDYPTWTVVGIQPLPNVEDYPMWVAHGDVSVLILDERLHESAALGTLSVGYQGHQVVDRVRGLLPSLPIWIITNYPTEDGLQDRFPDVEGIIQRDNFHKEAEKYIPRFIRAGGKFFDDHQKDLEKMAELSRKIAVGEATEVEIEEAKALQLYRTVPLEPLLSQSVWVSELERIVAECIELEARVEKRIVT